MIPSQLQSLANHLWQSTLFAAIAALLTLALRKNRAQTRYWLWLAASLKFLIPFSLLVDVGSHWGRHTAPAIFLLPSVIQQASEPFSVSDPRAIISPAEPSPLNWIPVVVYAVWAIGFATLVVSWFRRWRNLRMTLRTASPLDLPIGVEAMMSPAFPEPGVFGIRRAILLLPAGIADRLTQPQLHAVVTHELCHVRRRDNLASALHMGVEAVFWFHPLVWWLGARLMEERERACDEEVLLLGNEPEVYAQGILKICELYLESPLRCVAGVTGANLRKRIETIMANRVGLRLSFVKKLVLLTAGVAAVASPLIVGVTNPPAIQAQSQQPAATSRAFEVASVKPNHSVTGNSSIKTAPGGRFTAENVSPRALIQLAFGIRDFQLAGGPGWIGAEKYDVVAKTGGPKEMSSDEELKPLLQALLVDRFMLRFHRQTKQLPVYALVVAGGRPKLTANTTTSTTPSTSISSGGDKLKMEATKSSVARLCNILGRQLDRTVIDRTGLKGEFDFNLEWAPDQPVDSSGPSIFAALQEQLGLKLQARKGPVEIIVIDHIERPTAN